MQSGISGLGATTHKRQPPRDNNRIQVVEEATACLVAQTVGRADVLTMMWEEEQAAESGQARCPLIGTGALVQCHWRGVVVPEWWSLMATTAPTQQIMKGRPVAEHKVVHEYMSALGMEWQLYRLAQH